MSTEQTDWKAKFNELLDTCQSELKKTTQIGKKMLSASQSTAELNDIYKELGMRFKEAIEKGRVSNDDSEIAELVANASKLESDLEGFESDVRSLKKKKS